MVDDEMKEIIMEDDAPLGEGKKVKKAITQDDEETIDDDTLDLEDEEEEDDSEDEESETKGKKKDKRIYEDKERDWEQVDLPKN